MADLGFELRWGPGCILLAQPAFLPSVISSFSTQNKVGALASRAPPLDPPLYRQQMTQNVLTVLHNTLHF